MFTIFLSARKIINNKKEDSIFIYCPLFYFSFLKIKAIFYHKIYFLSRAIFAHCVFMRYDFLIPAPKNIEIYSFFNLKYNYLNMLIAFLLVFQIKIILCTYSV